MSSFPETAQEEYQPLEPRAIFRGILPLFVLGHFSHHILTAITIPLIPFIRGTFNLDYTESGFVVSAFTLAYGIGQLPAGWLADRMEPRKLMTVGISGVALAGILVGLSPTYFLLMASLALMGILGGGYHPATPPLIFASVRPENLGRSLGFHNIGGGASHFITPLIAVAIANAWGWRNAYIWMAVPTVIFGVIFYLLLGRIINEKKVGNFPRGDQDTHDSTRPEGIRPLLSFLILTTFASAAINSAVAFIPLLLVDHFGVSKELAAVLFSLIYAAAFWAGPLGGYLADRVGSIRVVLGVCLLAGPNIVLLTVLPYGWGIMALLLLLGMVIFARMSASESYVVDKTPVGSRSTILGIYYFTSMEGGGVLTPVVGYLIDQFGFYTAFASAGGAVFLVTLICMFGLWEGRGDRLNSQ